MPKRLSLLAGLVLLSVPTLALAKDKPEKRVQALLACQSIAASDARLACYDQAMSSLKEAIAQGTMVLKEKNAPLALEGTVKDPRAIGAAAACGCCSTTAIAGRSSRRKPAATRRRPGTRRKAQKDLHGHVLDERAESCLRQRRNFLATESDLRGGA